MKQAMLLVGDSMSNANLYYTTHFLAGDPFAYLQVGGQGAIIIGGFERARAEKESSVDCVIALEEYGYNDAIAELGNRQQAYAVTLARILEDRQVGNAVVEPSFPALLAHALAEADIDITIDLELLVPQRRHKSSEEIEAIAEAQRAAERAAAHAFRLLEESEEFHNVLHYGGIPLTSQRLRTELEVQLLCEGMDMSHSPIVAGGMGAADPHWLGEGPLHAGEAIVFDIFPRSKRTRYFADMTRTVVKGEPRGPLQRMYDAVLEAQEAALRTIRVGVSGREVHEAVQAVFTARGFDGEEGPRYIHGTGHGVGLDIHEEPSLSSRGEELEEGDVVTVEPGLYDPSVGGVRIEDLVVVTGNGYRNLTTFPKQFRL